jgi:hypothetical protein
MASTVKRRNPNILTYTRRNVLEIGKYRVQVGWSKAMGASPETVTIATYNVLGTADIPARDPLTPAIAANLDAIRQANVAAMRAVNRGDDPEPELEELAAHLESELKRSIEDFSSPPNADSTVASKGFNDPLIGEGADGGRIYDEAAAQVLKR